MLSNIVNKVRSRFTGRNMAARKSPAGLVLPPNALRMGGLHFQDDFRFVETAKADAERLAKHGLNESSRLLDWGCGAGRLAIGVLETWPSFGYYHGIDVQRHLIDWATANLARSNISFTWADAANARYNAAGQNKQSIPAASCDYDALYAYSVFSHMLSDDVKGYLSEICRVLKPSGFAFVTLFVEEDVAEEAENPEGYGLLSWKGPLHCVRFNRSSFEEWVTSVGLNVDHFEHGNETDGQSLYILRPRSE